MARRLAKFYGGVCERLRAAQLTDLVAGFAAARVTAMPTSVSRPRVAWAPSIPAEARLMAWPAGWTPSTPARAL